LAAKERRDRKELSLFVFFAFFRGYSFILPALVGETSFEQRTLSIEQAGWFEQWFTKRKKPGQC
jgi:hypothetical protein